MALITKLDWLVFITSFCRLVSGKPFKFTTPMITKKISNIGINISFTFTKPFQDMFKEIHLI